MKNQLAVVFLSNRWRKVDQVRFDRLVRECGEGADCFLIVDDRTAETTPLASAGGAGTHFFNAATLPAALGYPTLTQKGLMPGSMHFPLLDFARSHSYDKYLLVENDVEFTGHWAQLADVCRNGTFDLLASHVHSFAARPDWWWWNSLRDVQGNPACSERLVRAFLPFACYSRKALMHIDVMHQAGWTGHFEVLVPTLLAMAGMTVLDINTIGDFYVSAAPPVTQRKYANSSFSLRWRPPVTLEEFESGFRPDVIYHPVKDDWAWVDGTVQRFSL